VTVVWVSIYYNVWIRLTNIKVTYLVCYFILKLPVFIFRFFLYEMFLKLIFYLNYIFIQ